MKTIISLCVGTSLILALSGCSRSKPETTGSPTPTATATTSLKISSVNVVKVNPEEVNITAGSSAEATVRLNIDSGYHVNANPPTYPYLKATELEFKQSPPITVGFVIYPNATTRKFQFADKPLAVYEGEAVIKVQLKVDKGTPPGKQNLSGKLRVQACDEEVCYAPGERDVTIPVNIK